MLGSVSINSFRNTINHLQPQRPTHIGNNGSVSKLLKGRRLARYSLLGINVLILGGVVAFILYNSRSGDAADLPAKQQHNGYVTNPIDQLSSTDIAVNIARMDNLPEATAVKNQAESANAQLAIAQVSTSLVAKPQIVATDFLSNKGIKVYVVKRGDTVSSIASKFNITSASVRASNGLSGNAVSAGQKLYIPPVNGVVYVVKSGDTAASLASKYSASKSRIIAFNDAELKGLKKGERIVIPGGQKPSFSTFYAGYGLGAWGYHAIYGYNGYDYGNCTWYVANQITIPTNWGNAATWAYYAQLAGWRVSSSPSVGSIAQTPYAAGGFGHVAIVTAVSGGRIKYKDMNNYGDGGGFGRVGYSGWVSASTFPNYITR